MRNRPEYNLVNVKNPFYFLYPWEILCDNCTSSDYFVKRFKDCLRSEISDAAVNFTFLEQFTNCRSRYRVVYIPTYNGIPQNRVLYKGCSSA